MITNIILIAKALHVVGFVSWFAGLFYLGRVLVNHADTENIEPVAADGAAATRNRLKKEILHEEYSATAARVYNIIVNPAMMITWLAGLTMIGFNPAYLQSGSPGWLHVKLLFVVLLVVYQLYTKKVLMLPMAAGARPWSDWQLRLWNEVPTFFLVSVPFLAVFGKMGSLNYLYLAIGVALFSFMVWRGAVGYRKRRKE
ncbi:TIGR00701 family protein [Neolewinella aurantiaca]|uniref:Protoporphyrinogen IX oxidase n=1 Tax=Neolewinella aurantiaca TaxID=2602767 RepID=A0A5C7FWM8_9BACT|nr:CopD family protein [Neolewinella aurantiaca]TXF91084.1 TIGR00701 family protein [Neolewinella aurantiaca]